MTKAAKGRGLGKGLSALLMDDNADDPAHTSHVLTSRIEPNPYQPRKTFHEAELASLIASVRKDGILTPVLLRRMGDSYQLIAGERRWRAAQAVGLPEVPAVIRDVTDAQALELAIIENEQRDDLTAIESGRAYQRLMDDFHYTQQKISEHIGISRAQVSNLIRLLKLPAQIQYMVENRTLDAGHARPLIGLDSITAVQLARVCIAQGWSVRRMEQEVKRAQAPSRSKEAPPADMVALEEELTRSLSLKVQCLSKKNGGGELRLHYTQTAELEGILLRLRKTS
ncbi:MAG: ParB/RepB/Spo0J family partition protein [Mariprofundaceae bacterium]|nr:ParB/RepB/Spo0J family partition protein [Mariprofundaceae bacterium]